MSITTVVFDFDGTLANTNGLIIDSWKHVYREILGDELSEEAIKRTFGEPLAITMKKYFPDVPVDVSIGIYRDHQKDIFEELIEPFPGTEELIKGLKARGYKVGIVTSRLRNTTMIGLRKFGWLDFIDDIVTCDDTAKHKPDPEPALISLEHFGIGPDEAVMVGDSMFDIKCAHNAGMKAALVAWAEAVSEEERFGPDAPEYYIEKAEDLFDILQG